MQNKQLVIDLAGNRGNLPNYKKIGSKLQKNRVTIQIPLDEAQVIEPQRAQRTQRTWKDAKNEGIYHFLSRFATSVLSVSSVVQ